MARLNVALPRALDLNANPSNGGKLYVYQAGTTTTVTTYSDVAMTTAQAHPVLADSAGNFPEVYVPEGDYKVIIKTSADVTLRQTDNVSVAARNSYKTLAELAASKVLGDGDYATVFGGDNNEPETFKYVASSALTANGTTVVTATGMGVGQHISTRTTFADFAELDADVRPHPVDTILTIRGLPGFYKVVASSPSFTTTAGLQLLLVPLGTITPAHCGPVGVGADDQTAFSRWFTLAAQGYHATLNTDLRATDAVTPHPDILTATANVTIKAEPDCTITYSGAWTYRLMALKLDGFNADIDIGIIDGADLVGKGLHVENPLGSASFDNDVKLSAEGRNFRSTTTGNNGYQCGVMSFSGGCHNLHIPRAHGKYISKVTDSLDSLQCFVVSADLTNDLSPKNIVVDLLYAEHVYGDDYKTAASSDADGMAIFGAPDRGDCSCLIKTAFTREIPGRQLKLAHPNPTVEYLFTYRSLQGHTNAADVGSTGIAFQYGVGTVNRIDAVFEGADVFLKDADQLVTFSTQTVMSQDMRAGRNVNNVSITCIGTGSTYGMKEIVGFRGGTDQTADPNYTCNVNNVTMAGGFTYYGIGVQSIGSAARPAKVFATNFKANIKTAFAAADSNMNLDDFEMHLRNVHNSSGLTVPVILRQDAVDMVGKVGRITGENIEGVKRSTGVYWDGIDAGYAPPNSRYRALASNRSGFTNADVDLFDAATIASGDGTLVQQVRFPCEITVDLINDYGGAKLYVTETGSVTVERNIATTHFSAQADTEPADGTNRLWTTYDYSGTGGQIHFKSTDATARFFSVKASF